MSQELHPDPLDGRAKRVCLTERGRDLERTALAISREVEQELASMLGTRRLQRLREVLEELNDLLEFQRAVPD